MRRARSLARQLRVLAAVIREPGLRPSELAARSRVSERTLRRDLAALRRLGYPISYGDGYQLQESLRLDGAEGPRGLGGVYEQQVRALRARVPAALAERVEEELEAEAPAALAALIAAVLERRLGDRGWRSRRRTSSQPSPRRGPRDSGSPRSLLRGVGEDRFAGREEGGNVP